MDIATLHMVLLDRTHDVFAGFARLLDDVPDDALMKAEEAITKHPTNDLRKRWDRDLALLHWLLRHGPRDEFILALIPKPSEFVGMSADLMHELAAQAEDTDRFLELCRQRVGEYQG